MESVLAVLITWLSLNANMEIKQAPRVEVLNDNQFKELNVGLVYGIYIHKEKVIYLNDRVDLSTKRGKSVLLHELVHHWQNVSGKMNEYECFNGSERLAYETQRKYLIFHKAKLMKELGLFNIAMRSICGSDFL